MQAQKPCGLLGFALYKPIIGSGKSKPCSPGAFLAVQVVAFDLGGVLVRIAHTWAEVAQLAGLPGDFPKSALSEFPAFAQYQAGLIETGPYIRALKKFLNVTAEKALKAHLAILIEPYPETLDLVCTLEELGLRTGCLSNTNGPHWTVMTETDCFPAIRRLQHKLASHELGLEKPDPRIYGAFEAGTRFRGKEIVFFDDSPINVAAAREYGWNAYTILPEENPAAQMRDHLRNLSVRV